MAGECRQAGLTVVSSWLWAEPVDVGDPVAASHAAQRDLGDLREADLFVGFSEAASEVKQGGGGRHVETGVALALGKRVALVGPEAEHIFHRLERVEHYPDWEAARAVLLSLDG